MNRIKQWFTDSANILITLFVAIVGGVIYYLEQRLTKAEYRAGQLEADKQLSDVISKKDEAENEATQKENEYRRVRDAYMSNSDDSAGKT